MLNSVSGGLKIQNAQASGYLSSAVKLLILFRTDAGILLTLLGTEIIINQARRAEVGLQ